MEHLYGETVHGDGDDDDDGFRGMRKWWGRKIILQWKWKKIQNFLFRFQRVYHEYHVICITFSSYDQSNEKVNMMKD